LNDRFRDAGYFTCNVRDIAEGVRGDGKTDFNFDAPKPFDGTHWNQRQKGQPFYAQVNFQAPHKGPAFVQARKQKTLVDPAKWNCRRTTRTILWCATRWPIIWMRSRCSTTR
jgi:hypothetical protein